MSTPSILTVKRRDLLAKTVMDINKIIIAAAFASDFFSNLNAWLRFSLVASFFSMMIVSMFICPKKKEE